MKVLRRTGDYSQARVRPGSRNWEPYWALTCLALDELGPLVRSAERRHHDLIMASRGEGGEPMLPRVARQRHGGEDPRVVEEQSHLMTEEEHQNSPELPSLEARAVLAS